MANTTSVTPKEIKAKATELGLGGFGSRGRVAAPTIAAVLTAEPKMLKTVASDLGINLSEFRGNARKELIVSLSEQLV